MILLAGSPFDETLKYFASFLFRNKVPFVFLNQEKFPLTSNIDLEYLYINNSVFTHDSFSGVLNRLCLVSFSDCKFNTKVKASTTFLNAIFSTNYRNVLNSVENCVANDSKLYQLTHLNYQIVRVPECIVLAKKQLNYLYQDKKDYIYKSLSSIRSIVTKLDKKNTIPDAAVLFQELLKGENIRVHVINERCFSTLIVSSKVDYRYDSVCRYFKDFDLPEKIQQECIKLSKESQLAFCGIDLIKCNNVYYLLEINPTPGYIFYEKNLPHNNISIALMEILNES